MRTAFLSNCENIILIFTLAKTAFLSSYKNVILTFALFRIAVSFYSLHEMINSENSPDNYKTLKVELGTIIKNPEILKFVLDHLNTKKVCKKAVKKLPFIVR